MKMSKNIYKLILILLLVFVSAESFAGVNELSDYYKTVRCLVCEGQSIQESDTEFAINLKEQIQKKYSSGMPIEEINQELIKIYGEEISFNPPKNHILLWGTPLIVLIIIFIFIRNKIRFFNKL
jgi:cytochrome c-type biogenesis protein CcmH